MARPKKQDDTDRYMLSARVDVRLKNLLRIMSSIKDKNEHLVVEDALWEYMLENWHLISAIKIPEDIRKKKTKKEDLR